MINGLLETTNRAVAEPPSVATGGEAGAFDRLLTRAGDAQTKSVSATDDAPSVDERIEPRHEETTAVDAAAEPTEPDDVENTQIELKATDSSVAQDVPAPATTNVTSDQLPPEESTELVAEEDPIAAASKDRKQTANGTTSPGPNTPEADVAVPTGEAVLTVAPTSSEPSKKRDRTQRATRAATESHRLKTKHEPEAAQEAPNESPPARATSSRKTSSTGTAAPRPQAGRPTLLQSLIAAAKEPESSSPAATSRTNASALETLQPTGPTPSADAPGPRPSLVEQAKVAASHPVEPLPASTEERRGLINRLSAATGRSRSRAAAGEVEVDRVRFVQRVARAFQSIGPEGGHVRLRLSPPSLGSAQLEITVHADLVTARLEVENPAARQLLVDSLPALRERLAQHDLKIVRFDIDLMGDRPGASPGETASGQSGERQTGHNHSGHSNSNSTPETTAPTRLRRSDRALDLLA
jgi:flagellar hook-length control protein FliK